MADNFNINTTQSQANEAEGLDNNNPAMTYVDFGNQIANNAQKQQEQAQLVQQAMLQNQASTLANKQKQAASDQGINPATKGYMSKDEAIALIKAELSRQNLLTDDVNTQIQAWYDAAPAMVEQQDVKDFISKYQPKSPTKGTPFVATASDAKDTDMTDTNGKPLVSGQTYYSTQDEDGDTVYERGGEAPSTSNKADQQAEQFWVREFAQVVNKVNPYLSSSRTQVGVALQSYIRCTRALETLSKSPLTKQDATNVISEIGAVYKGGSPDQAQVLETQYQTLYGWFQQSIQGLFGIARTYVPEDIRRQLVSRVTDLENTSRQVIESSLQAAQAGYGEIISHNQDQWDKLVAYIDKALADPNAAQPAAGSSSYSPTATSDLRTNTPAAGDTDVEAKKAALRAKLGI